jgi:hypothetical protein
LNASLWLANSVNSVLGTEGGPGSASGGVWKAMPPSRMEVSDCVCTRKPAASSATSTPLAFQKRLPAVTKRS